MTANDPNASLSNPAAEGVPSAGAVPPNGLNRQPQQQRHIVVVNDTQEILELFREILEKEGYRVSLYSYAFQDISDIEALRPDLVILDFVIGGEAHGW